MPTHLYLPELSKDNKLSEPPQPGVWDSRQGERRLSVLADAIAVPPGVNDIHSVPDPWAQVILFDRALFDDGHTLHWQVMGEWRGILALLGLRERMGLQSLQAYEVDLRAKPAAVPNLLSAVLRRVLPNDPDVLHPEDTWAHFYILSNDAAGASARGVPFGMTSPTTLVAAGAYYPSAFTEAEVPWFRFDRYANRNLLTDPVKVLAETDRNALAEWVWEVRAQFAERTKNTTSARIGPMLTALQSFAEELAPGKGASKDGAKNFSERGLGLSYGSARLLDRPHTPEQRELSHLMLEGDVAHAKRYVLIDMQAAEKLGKDAKEVVVYRDVTLATVRSRLPRSVEDASGFVDAQREPELRWCTSKFFFQPFLVYQQGTQTGSSGSAPNPFPGCRPVTVMGVADPRQILLPLQEEATELFTADYLAKHFSVEWKGSEGALCRLRLLVRSASLPDEHGTTTQGEPRVIVITHLYPPDMMVKMPALPPAVGVWPNLRMGNRWQRYFIFESWHGLSQKQTDDVVVRPLKQTPSSARLLKSGVEVFQIHEVQQFPEVLSCQMAPRETKGMFEARPQALMLLQAPEQSPVSAHRSAALGIDFGTTGTSIYWSWSNDGSPRQMEFKDRMLRVTAYDKNALGTITRELFIPARDWSTGKILSVYQVFSDPAPQEVLDGHVLFSDDQNPGSFIAGEKSGVRSQLKWGDDRQNEAADGFLAQLCSQSLLELVSQGADTVDIRYSYPTAFSVTDEARFRGIWRRVIARIAGSTAITLTNNGDDKENREAVAATRFFAQGRQGLSISRGALTVDIGGGTTDVALWSKDAETSQPALLAHLSVMLAGQDMFLEPILLKPEVLRVLDPSIPIESLLEKKDHPDAYKAQLDALIASRGEAMLEALAGREDRVKEFLSVMTTGLCGLGFYAGLLTGRLAQVGAYVPQDRLPVFVGGNGSRLLKWCAINHFVPEMPIYRKLAASIVAGCRIGYPETNVKVEISLSPKPKEEVAFGLVAYGLGSNAGQLKINEDYTNPLAGESYEVRGAGTQPWSSSTNGQNLRDNELDVTPGLPIFREFVKAAGLSLEDDTLSRLQDKVNDQITGISQKAALLPRGEQEARAVDPLRKEPLFIMAVKELLRMQIDQWVDHA